MKTLLIAGAACVLAAALSGCAGFGSSATQSNADLLKQLDSNFAQCDRHITFQAGVGVITPGAQVSGSVDCKGNGAVSVAASALTPAATVAPAATSAP